MKHQENLWLMLILALNSLMCQLNGQELTDQDISQELLFGELDAKVRVFRFVLQPDAKSKSMTLKSLEEGEQVFPLKEYIRDEKKLSFELPGTKAEFAGNYDSKSRSYVGEWKQGGRSIPLQFKTVKTVPRDRAIEFWEGEINTGLQKLTLRFRVYDKESKHQVLMDSVTQRLGGFVGKIKKDGDQIEFDISVLGGKMTGKLNKDKSAIEGIWNQNADFPIHLKKVTKLKPQPAAPKRPQTPQPPFPYKSVEMKIRNESAKLTLSGTLTLPATQTSSSGKVPCVILISGSGPQDRDETILGHKPFWVIADFLSRSGIAVFRFDDRGTGKSTGNHATATTKDFSEDVEAVFDELLKHPGINPDQIGLCGHSEGGLIAPMVASRRKEVGFMILLAAPGVNGSRIVENQTGLILQASGIDKKNVTLAVEAQKRMLKFLKQHPKPTSQQIESLLEEMRKELPDITEKKETLRRNINAGIKRLSSPWMKFFLSYEPVPALEKSSCPVLVLNGSKDTQVDPELNVPVIKKALDSGGNTRVEVAILPNLNHLFQNCESGSPDEYEKIEETFSPKVLKQMHRWIQNLNQTP